MKKLIIYTLSIFALFSINTSCSDDFLDAKPTEVLTAEQIKEASENNPEAIAGSMKGIYTLMFKAGTGGYSNDDDFGQKGYDIYTDMLSADMALSKSAYGWYLGDITQFQGTIDFTNKANYKIWRYYYRIIRSANSVIDALGGNDIVPELDASKHVLGQAKTMRAYSYFYLSQLFQESYTPNNLILPLYTDSTAPNQPKSMAKDVYDLIIKDLTDAISLLDTFDRFSKNEVNKSIAQAFLAYTYSAMGGTENYSKAKDLTETLINSGNFNLMSEDEIAYTGTGDLVGGFNDVNTSGWMWGVDITTNNDLNDASWWSQMDVFTYGYQFAGDKKTIDAGLYAKIPTDDARKNQFEPLTSSEDYLTPLNKFYASEREIGGQRAVTSDYVYMRIAEMYLLHAETAAKSGDEAAAKTSLKTLLDLRIPDTSYIDTLSGQSLQDEIYLQTRIELWGEGKSYLAMKRNKATIVRGENHLSNVGTPISYDDDRLTFEIPQSEIQNNPFISK